MRLINSFPHWLVASTTPTTSKATTSSSGTSLLLFLALAFALFYFLFLRPNRRRQMQALRAKNAFDLGDEVVAGGMVGKVVRLGDGEVEVEVSDGVIVKFVPAAVQLRSAYMAGPAGRRLAQQGGPGGGAFGNRGAGGSGMGSAGDDGSGAGNGPAAAPARVRSVRRRAAAPASDAWPDVSDNSLTTGDDVGGGASGETGTSDGGVGPADGDS